MHVQAFLALLLLCLPPLWAQDPEPDDFNPGAAWYISSLVVQPDGKVLAGGEFGFLGGQPRDSIGRLNADGTLDSSFNPGANGIVVSLALQDDGKILVGGVFTTLCGQPRSNIGRLNSDGTLDNTFNPGASYTVEMLTVQADGRILVGGAFTNLGGQPRNHIGRLNSDGTLDDAFNPGANDSINSVAMQEDGRILIGGRFTAVGGQFRNFIARLNPDGTLDSMFNPAANYWVYSLALQPDGKIVLGGYFTGVGGQIRERIARLNSDGTVDIAFNPRANNWVYSLALQTDGKIVVGGWFNGLGDERRDHIARLNSDGTLDSTFNPTANLTVRTVAVQADGKILLGGYFTTVGGQPRERIARLNSNAPATQSVNFDDSSITWLRSGSGPEIWNAIFQHSTNGLNWRNLGAGDRIAGGWRLTGLSPPSNGTLRVRGYTTAGYQNASSFFVEGYQGTPRIISEPASRTNRAGSTAIFRMVAGISAPWNVRWFKNGLLLPDQGNGVDAANVASLTLSNVWKADEGGYNVVLSNAFGSLTSTVVTLTVIEPVISRHPLGTNLSAGDDITFEAKGEGTPPLSYQWYHDGIAVPGAVGSSLALQDLSGADAGMYCAVVSNVYGSVTSNPALLMVNTATLDNSFNLGASWNVSSFAVQLDGKIVAGGAFTTLGGQSRHYIARLNADGTLDDTFNPRADNGVGALAVQADGKILAAGTFTWLGGESRNHIGRLNADGTLDKAFNPDASGEVVCMAVQLDGRILVGGTFFSLGGQLCTNIGRLNADGTVDGTFIPGANDRVHSMALQADGKVLVGGRFTELGGQPRNHIGRLNSDGTVDSAFNPGADYVVESIVESIAMQADGKILVGGLGRFNADGTLDRTFKEDARVFALQEDGRILVGGWFWDLGGYPRTHLGRLNGDGTPDFTFKLDADFPVYSLAVLADGKILVGGNFNTLGGEPRSYIGRLNSTGPATQSLSYDGTRVTWLRGGTSPGVWQTVFEHSTNGGRDWTWLGTGERIPGGWELNSVSLPPDGTLRARGRVTGGNLNASSWFVQSFRGKPVFFSQPTGRTNIGGTVVSFEVMAGDTNGLSYQWLKNGVELADHGNAVGTKSNTLTLSDVFKADEGNYSVELKNSFGSVTSAVATLAVLDPFITQQPAGTNRNSGDGVTFNVTAVGTPPLGYTWQHDGVASLGPGGSSLILDDLSKSDAGIYTVVVSNAHGSVTSAPATLRINAATLDKTFTPGANSTVYSLLLQPDGKILAGGSFTNLGGVRRHRIARLHANGTLDDTLNPAADNTVSSMSAQPDGMILVAGAFTNLAGQQRYRIARLHADGTLDGTFSPGADAQVSALALQPDGRIVVGGTFTTLGGQPRNRIGRLHANGTLDETFNPNANSQVMAMAVRPDGKIIVGGSFSTLGGRLRSRIGLLHSDGTLDDTFDLGANGIVYTIVVLPDGKMLVGGAFTVFGGLPRDRICLLNSDGTLDNAFNPGANNLVFSFGLQTDGKILVGGAFNTLGGQPRTRIGRLNADGTPDNSFFPGAGSTVLSVALQTDGMILVGGAFGSLGGQACDRIGRLNNTDPSFQKLDSDGRAIVWLREGTSPEVWRTTFEHTTDGLNWNLLGLGERICGGWQLTGVSLPADGTLRARGYVTGGYMNSSGGIVEATMDAPWSIRLHLVREGSTAVLSWTGGRGPYQVQQTTDAGQSNSWQDVGVPMHTNSISLPIGPGAAFLRVRGQ